MKKLFVTISVTLIFFSCKKDSSYELEKENTVNTRSLLRTSASGSMVVDINCPSSLPGNKDWENKDVFFSQSSPVQLISGNECSIIIKKYITAKNVTLFPSNSPAVLSFDESGTGSFEHIKYIDRSGDINTYLSAISLNYNTSVYENSSFPVINTNGIVVYPNSDLKNVSVPANSSKTITFKFSSFSDIVVSSLSADISFLNKAIGPGGNDWKVLNVNNCSNFSSLCTIDISYSPKATITSKTANLLIHFYRYSSDVAQSTRIPIQFKSSN